jgi:hypothetical protein
MTDFAHALKFYCNELGIDPSKIILFLSEADDMDVAGYCDRLDDEYVVKLVETQLEHNAPPLAILAHELVHVMQYESGLLEDLPDGLCRWKGKIYLDPCIFLCENIYYNAPWEHQAYALQDRLYYKYLRSLGQ